MHGTRKDLRWLTKRGRIVLAILLVVVILLAGLLYSQRHQIHLLISGSRVVGSKVGVANLHLPPGFHASVFYSGLSTPRFITFSPDGTLFVAESGAGSIVALPDPQHTGKALDKVVVVRGLDDPTSLVFYKGALYVGEQSHVSRFTLGPGLRVMSKQIIVPNLPTGGDHITRTILIGPDGNLYVSIGSTCNVCVESDPHRAAIWVYHLDGSGGQLYARGLRNAVGMAINPWNRQIWVTDNGSDYMGDNIPPDTIYALQDGGDYGWPRCQAGNIIDPNYGHPGDCNSAVQPLLKLQAHSAPLGLAFYSAGQFPRQYHGLFVAFHGSWNRSAPTGYKVVFIPMDASGHISGSAQDFATNWLVNNDTAVGRPVGLTVGSDGTLYISDDLAGIIYRVTWTQHS